MSEGPFDFAWLIMECPGIEISIEALILHKPLTCGKEADLKMIIMHFKAIATHTYTQFTHLSLFIYLLTQTL